MFGSRTPPPRPILLMLVFGAFLAIVGATATAQSALVGEHFRTSALIDVVSSDAATTRAFVNAYVLPTDLTGDQPMNEAYQARLEAQFAALTRTGEILRIELRRPDGRIVAASDPALRGAMVPVAGEFAEALAGGAIAALGPSADAAAGPGSFESPTLVREFLPISVDGTILGVIGIWRDAEPILARLDDVRRQIVVVTLSAALIAAALLFLVFRTAQARLSRQTAALLESTRRDPLTEVLNHGAIVGLLAESLERARAAGRPIGIALVDIDNFRLLNDTHGHEAGDQTLLVLADTLAAHGVPGVELGRYGPDEFLLIAEPAAVAHLEPLVDRLRTELVDLSLRFDESERLPISISVGIATYPEHAASVTTLLSVAAQVLEGAKASGGDTVRVAERPSAGDVTETSTFDVLQGLVIAVDTKDRYTKRHSEDVARYATFIGQRIGMSAAELHTLGVAGLLHDVGKIGVPDQILRKPSKLTAGEYGVLQQHVALGDMIVRDLPDVDVIRAGIRHHHERWDGDGYLDRLEGEEIPLVARILAVADAFSAMTTTRPYRKSFGIQEALTRLGDASGTQLDERLVRVFMEGIERDSTAPLPGEPGTGRLWLPRRRVA
ncbi:MAG: diguanylate cyclase [Chloroflexota bacterium]